MTETLWLAGLLVANLWGAGSLNVNNTDKSEPGVAAPPPRIVIVDPGAPAPILHCEETPILSQIPYLGRLFRTCGYSIDSTGTVEPPIKAGEKANCENPPTKEEILRALPSLARGIPYVYEQYREEVDFTVEKLLDRVDDPRFFPLIGPAQLHHCQWKCTVSYTDVIETVQPFAFKARTKHEYVVYIDKDHLHLCGDQKDDGAAETSEPPLLCPGGHFAAKPPTAPTKGKICVIVEGGDDERGLILQDAAEQTVLDAVESVKWLKADCIRKIRVSRVASEGKDERVELPVDWKAITERGQTASNYQLEAGDRVHVYVDAVKEPRETSSQAMSIDDVVKMWRAGVSQKIILRQMELTNTVFNLTADDIVNLHEQGVSKRIISAMQERRERGPASFPPALAKYSAAGSAEESEPKNASTVITEVMTFWYDQVQFVDDTGKKGERLPNLVGRVWLRNEESTKLLEANGCISVEMHDNTSGVKLSEWRFDAESLKSLKKSDLVGMGYTLFLPWDGYRPEITQVELRVVYMPENEGRPQHAEAQVIRLRTAEASPILQKVQYQK